MLGKKKEKNFAVQEIERYEKRGFFMNYGKMAHKRFGFLINNRLNLSSDNIKNDIDLECA